MIREKLLDFWYRPSRLAYLLQPIAWIFQLLTYGRYCWYRHIKGQATFSVPIIMVGNITLGGTGKTPLVAFLVNALKKSGFEPGIVMRGYGGQRHAQDIISVDEQSAIHIVGDEARLLAKLSACPLVVGVNRTEAVRQLLTENPQVNIVISDDGLQHYALARKIEIAVMDGIRRLGNGYCLPVGPLREPPKRLQKVDFVVVNGGQARSDEWQMHSSLHETVYAVSSIEKNQLLTFFQYKTVHAVAGIGYPERFFNMLASHGLKIIPHVFADHHFYSEQDVDFKDDIPILMTQKDAVKCSQFSLKNAWYVTLKVELPEIFMSALLRRIQNG